MHNVSISVFRTSPREGYYGELTWVAVAALNSWGNDRGIAVNLPDSQKTAVDEGKSLDEAINRALDRLGRQIDAHPSLLRPFSVLVEVEPREPTEGTWA